MLYIRIGKLQTVDAPQVEIQEGLRAIFCSDVKKIEMALVVNRP
jgi:hypothetical protein